MQRIMVTNVVTLEQAALNYNLELTQTGSPSVGHAVPFQSALGSAVVGGPEGRFTLLKNPLTRRHI